MKRSSLFVVVLMLVGTFAEGAAAQVSFRMPLDMTRCGSSGCYVSAHYDTNRGSGIRDWGCGTHTYAQHLGNDYGVGGFAGMDAGRPVVAAAPGVVISAHDGEFDRCTSGNCGTANYVKIRHSDGKVSWYWHFKKWSVTVQVGDNVTCGQKLGEVGSSGLSSGPHVHFQVETSQGGVIDDPYASPGGCGGSASWWESQGAYNSLPAAVCQGGNDFCIGKANGYWCNGDALMRCSGGGVVSETACQYGCQGMPFGTPDVCAAEPPATTGTVQGVAWDLAVTDDAAASLDLGARLPGTVITSSSGASVTARDDDGYWSLELDPGSHTLTATLDGYLQSTRDVVVTAGTEQWASMGLEPEPPPPSEPEEPAPPVDDEEPDAGVAFDELSDAGLDVDDPDAGAVDGFVLVPQQPIGADVPAADDDDGVGDDEGTGVAVGCRCVASPLEGRGATTALGMFVLLGALVRRRHRPARPER